MARTIDICQDCNGGQGDGSCSTCGGEGMIDAPCPGCAERDTWLEKVQLEIKAVRVRLEDVQKEMRRESEEAHAVKAERDVLRVEVARLMARLQNGIKP